MSDFLGFVIRPFRNLNGRLLFAELSPEGKVIGKGFTEIEPVDGSPMNLEKDQVVLVSYQINNEQVSYSVVNSWFVTYSLVGKLLNLFPSLWHALSLL